MKKCSIALLAFLVGCGASGWRTARTPVPPAPDIDRDPACGATSGELRVIATTTERAEGLHRLQEGPTLLEVGGRLYEVRHGRVLEREPIGPGPARDFPYALTGVYPNHVFAVLSKWVRPGTYRPPVAPWALRRTDGTWQPLDEPVPSVVVRWGDEHSVLALHGSGWVARRAPDPMRVLDVRHTDPAPPSPPSGFDPHLFPLHAATDARGDGLVVGRCAGGGLCGQRADDQHLAAMERLPMRSDCRTLITAMAFATVDARYVLAACERGDKAGRHPIVAWGARHQQGEWRSFDLPRGALPTSAAVSTNDTIWLVDGNTAPPSVYRRRQGRRRFERLDPPVRCDHPPMPLLADLVVAGEHDEAYLLSLDRRHLLYAPP